MPEGKKSNAQAVISLLLVIFAIWYFFGGGLEKNAAKTLSDIEKQVAEDALRQYEITKRAGDKTDICVHAGFVAAAYLQAKDELNYKYWKEQETADCKQVGM